MDQSVFVGTNPSFDVGDAFWKQKCEILPAARTVFGVARTERTVMVAVCPGRLVLVEERAWAGRVPSGGLEVVWMTRKHSTRIALGIDIPLTELREHRHTLGPSGPAVPGAPGQIHSLVNDRIQLLEVATGRSFRLAGLYSRQVEPISTALRRAGLTAAD